MLLLVTVCHVSVLCDEVLIVDRIHLFLHRATCMISCGNVRFVPSKSENRDCYTFCLFVCLSERGRGWYVLCNTRKYFSTFHLTHKSYIRYVNSTCTQDIDVRVW